MGVWQVDDSHVCNANELPHSWAEGTAISWHLHMIGEAALADAISATETDALVCIRVFRDAAHENDTCTDAVMVPLVDLHYQRDDGVGTLSKSPTWSKV